MEEKRRHEASLPLAARCAELRSRKNSFSPAPPRHDRFAWRCQPAATDSERWRSPPIAAFIWPPSLHSDSPPKPCTRKLAAIRGGALPPEAWYGRHPRRFCESMPSGLIRRDQAQQSAIAIWSQIIARWAVM